ncbi:hypothetical protein [Endozoicomonas lisbonensis]|uniref:Uncharacterized protein n=1 Tax=Endozoicomonas lisbonensis TaxID=3120522 RepID=A0ABV2SD94_9GAMM
MSIITINNGELSLKIQDSVTKIPFGVEDLDEMLCFAETFINKQPPVGQKSESDHYLSALKSDIKKSQHQIDTEFFCECLSSISSEMNQFLPPGYDLFENERLCMEFLQNSSRNLKSGEVGDLYILSCEKNDDQSSNMIMVLNPPFKELMLSLYHGDPELTEEEKISNVISTAICNMARKVLDENGESIE